MDQAIKQEWVAALRSGEYVQGRGYLRDRHDKFCCLGVLCEIAVKHGVIPPAAPRDDDADCQWYGDSDIYTPEVVVEWADLPYKNPRVTHSTEGQNTLAGFNDDHYTFNDIADMIEADL